MKIERQSGREVCARGTPLDGFDIPFRAARRRAGFGGRSLPPRAIAAARAFARDRGEQNPSMRVIDSLQSRMRPCAKRRGSAPRSRRHQRSRVAPHSTPCGSEIPSMGSDRPLSPRCDRTRNVSNSWKQAVVSLHLRRMRRAGVSPAGPVPLDGALGGARLVSTSGRSEPPHFATIAITTASGVRSRATQREMRSAR